MRLLNICGARPNFMKIAPLMRAYIAHPEIDPILVHTGQHYDERMSRLFFDELEIPRPDVDLEVGSDSHARQTAKIMERFEPLLTRYSADAILVVGDVNSTLACALVAAKSGVPVFHVEAGLRSFDRRMPEEVNRIVTDSLSDLLFVSEPSGIENLRNEGIPESRIHFAGNVMIDTLEHCRKKAEASSILERLHLRAKSYALVTLHRPSSVDAPQVLQGLVQVLQEIRNEVPVIFPVHPRTRTRIEKSLPPQNLRGLTLLEPQGYLDFLHLMSNARIVLTDSGGIQEETTILGIPCLTLRENTERPITLTEGTNRLTGLHPEHILGAVHEVLSDTTRITRRPEKWDGKAAERIARWIAEWAKA